MATLRIVSISSVLLLLALTTPVQLPVWAADNKMPEVNCPPIADAPPSAFPALAKGCGEQLSYVGAYFADGKFRTNALSSSQAQNLPVIAPGAQPSYRPMEVPPSIDLHARERTVENLKANSSIQKTAHRRSRLADWRDDIITLVYGRELAMLAPEHLTTDSRGRVIVSDPTAQAIHVLDSKEPFRILAGPEYRLQHAGAIATNAAGHIFVADPVVGVVVEFDRDGRYLREIGKLGEDEGIFHQPVAIAIDVHHFLYVADSERDMVIVLNSEGRILKRAGGRRRELGVTFQHPRALVLKDNRLFVLDADGTRVQVFDTQFRPITSFATGVLKGLTTLDVDSAGNVYLSGEMPEVYIYDRDGRRKGQFGRFGSGRGEIGMAAGLWIDSNDKMYVADKRNRRINVIEVETDRETVGTIGISGSR